MVRPAGRGVSTKRCRRHSECATVETTRGADRSWCLDDCGAWTSVLRQSICPHKSHDACEATRWIGVTYFGRQYQLEFHNDRAVRKPTSQMAAQVAVSKRYQVKNRITQNVTRRASIQHVCTGLILYKKVRRRKGRLIMVPNSPGRELTSCL